MSRFIKNINIVFLFIVLSINWGRCIAYSDELAIFKAKNETAKKVDDKKQNDKEKKPVDMEQERVINQMPFRDPSDIVDNLLQAPSKNLNIAIVAPITGDYASIGAATIESVLLTMSRSKYDSTGTAKIYNIGKLTDNNWKENEEVKRLIADDNDVIVGLFFDDTTEKLLSLIPDKLFISITNDNRLTKKYSNLIVLGIDDSFKINSLFRYLKSTNRQFLSLVLPATKKGYALEKLFRRLASYNDDITSS